MMTFRDTRSVGQRVPTRRQLFGPMERGLLDSLTADSTINRRNRGKANPVVLLLLESPHADEYMCDRESARIQSIAPAQGVTGDRINAHLAEVLKHGLSPEDCGGASVVIANPVPYQASLVSISNQQKKWRPVGDAVWAALWKIEAVREHFAERLRQCNPDIVINACTGARAKSLPYAMNALVATFVAARCPAAKLYATTHPSSWWKAGHRWLKPVLV